MRLAIERAALLRSLGHVQSVVERRSTVPILGNVKLEAADGELRTLATDLDLSLSSRQPATIDTPGATSVAAHLLYDIVRKLPEGSEVLLEQPAGANDLSVRAGRSVFALATLPAAEFPQTDEEALSITFELAAPELRRLIDKTRFAMSTEETRYYLNGVHLHATRGGAAAGLRAVATDGHRLARVEIPLPEGARQMPAIILPRKTAGEIRRLIEELDGPVGISLSANRIQFVVDGNVLISRLIDGTFPDYERVIPSGNEKTALVDRRSFAESIDRVATIATDKARAVKLAFKPGSVHLSAVSAESGRAEDEIDCEFTGEPIEIGFNARYVLDITAQIDGPAVRIEMANPAAPTLLRDPEDASTLYVLMPMRV